MLVRIMPIKGSREPESGINGITSVSLHTGLLVFLTSSSSESSPGLRDRFLDLDDSPGAFDRRPGGGGTFWSSGVDALVWPIFMVVGTVERVGEVFVLLLREDGIV